VNTLEKLIGLGVTAGADPTPDQLAARLTWNPEMVPDLPRWNSGGEAASVPTRLVRNLGRAPLRLFLPLLTGPGNGIQASLPYDLEID